jgi:hypothetical protein
MRFKEFVKMDELFGQFGDIETAKRSNTPTGPFHVEKRLNCPVKKKGTTVGRAMAAGKVKSPSRPVGVTLPNKSMIIPSVI